MKNIIGFVTMMMVLLVLYDQPSFSQGVAINDDNAAPDPSAMLDVKSLNKGVLFPRMYLSERMAILNPATGLTVFQTDGVKGLYYNAGTPASPMWALVGNNAGQWLYNGTSIYYNSGKVGAGMSAPPAALSVMGSGNNPSFPGINSTGILRIGNSADEGIDIGKQGVEPYTAWLQAGYNGIEKDPISLQPLGGNVGIGTMTPAANFHVAENGPAFTANFGTPINAWSGGTNVSVADDNEDAVLYVGQETYHKGFSIWQYNANVADAYYSLGTYNGSNNLVLQEYGGNVGVRTTAPAALFHVQDNVPGYTGLFGTPISIYVDGTNVSIGDDDATSVLYIGQSPSNKGFLLWNRDPVPGNAFFTIGTYSGSNPLVLQGLGAAGGKVGIGITSPAATLHVNEFSPGNTAVFGTPISLYGSGTNVSIGDNNAASLLYIGQDETHKGVLSWQYNAAAATAYFAVGAWGGNNNLILQDAGGNVGIGTTQPSSKLDVRKDNYGYAMMGYQNATPNYFVHNEIVANGDAQSAIYAFRTRGDQNDGTGYAYFNSNTAVKGFSFWGDLYSFGTAGFNYNDFTRCGGVLGSDQNGTYWGALGYRSSGPVNYGGYFTSSGSGTGKGSQAETGIGIGAWGGLLGADIHGTIYGIYAEGANYASFANGPVYKNNVDVHLQETGGSKNTVLYTNVSTDVTVQTCGYATLDAGNATIAFDPAFTASVSSESPIVVTVTPTGNSNGVYLSEVSKSGFTVVENNGGKSNVTVSFIAIGKRAGYENPSLSPEVVDASYTRSMARGLHNDADTKTNGEGLYYENGRLTVGIHPSTLPDPNKPSAESIMPKPSLPEKQTIPGDQASTATGVPGPAEPPTITTSRPPVVDGPTGGVPKETTVQPVKMVVDDDEDSPGRSNPNAKPPATPQPQSRPRGK